MALLTFLMPLFKKKKKSGYSDEIEEEDGGAKMLSHFVSLKSDKINNNGEEGGEIDENSGYQKLSLLMAPFVLRRRKDQVLSQILPPKMQVLKKVKMSKETSEIYNNVMRAHAAAKLNQQQSKVRMEEERLPTLSVMTYFTWVSVLSPPPPSPLQNIFTELRKVCNQPLLLRTRWMDSKSISTLTRWLRNSGFFGTNHTLTDDLVRSELADMSDFAIHSACQSMMQEKPILVEVREGGVACGTRDKECDATEDKEYDATDVLLPPC
jgi:SWI/SNF-related matrix-associated actin-dependent regulator 1 of chromatin subfamily A